MQVELQHYYHIKYLPYRARSMRTAIGQAYTTVEINELSTPAAPVVAKISDPTSKIFEPFPDGRAKRLRYVDGKHYIEDLSVSEFLDRVQAGRFTYFEHCSEAYQRNRIFPINVETTETIRDKEKHPLKELIDDKGRSVGAVLQAIADHILIVDGVVYNYTPEPVLSYSLLYNYGPTTKARACNDFHVKSIEDELAFNLYESFSSRDKERLVSLTNLTEQDISSLNESEIYVDIIDQRGFCFDHVRHNLKASVENLLLCMGIGLPRMNREWIESYIEIRDAFDSSGGYPTSRLRDAIAGCQRLQQGPFGHGGHDRFAMRRFGEREKETEYLGHNSEQFWRNVDAAIERSAKSLEYVAHDQYAHCDVYDMNGAFLDDNYVFALLTDDLVKDMEIACQIDSEYICQLKESGSEIYCSYSGIGASRKYEFAAISPDGECIKLSPGADHSLFAKFHSMREQTLQSSYGDVIGEDLCFGGVRP